ncbi:UNKNOWN [Stylonychia lemnae]|uniref:Uncharacterized protein n=1 Tax=Stylonychia lemnae TaxID=5949 RepID=A0A078AR25_STYLE|nr:UNKNOWN [Stylonychia lemnae]|eukprot:CDW84411.1 UNKNOWN [Stylonychia lemnae]
MKATQQPKRESFNFQDDCEDYDEGLINEEHDDQSMRNYVFKHKGSLLQNTPSSSKIAGRNVFFNQNIGNNSELIIESIETSRKKSYNNNDKEKPKDSDLNYFNLIKEQAKLLTLQNSLKNPFGQVPDPTIAIIAQATLNNDYRNQSPNINNKQKLESLMENGNSLQIEANMSLIQSKLNKFSHNDEGFNIEGRKFQIQDMSLDRNNPIEFKKKEQEQIENFQQLQKINMSNSKLKSSESDSSKSKQTSKDVTPCSNTQQNYGLMAKIRKDIIKNIEKLFQELSIKDYYFRVQCLNTLDSYMQYNQKEIIVEQIRLSNTTTQYDSIIMVGLACVVIQWNKENINESELNIEKAFDSIDVPQKFKTIEYLNLTQEKIVNVLENKQQTKQDNFINLCYVTIMSCAIEQEVNRNKAIDDFLEIQSEESEETRQKSDQREAQNQIIAEIKEEIFTQFLKGLYIQLLETNSSEVNINLSFYQSQLLLKALNMAKMKVMMNMYLQNVHGENLQSLTRLDTNNVAYITQVFNQLQAYFETLHQQSQD